LTNIVVISLLHLLRNSYDHLAEAQMTFSPSVRLLAL